MFLADFSLFHQVLVINWQPEYRFCFQNLSCLASTVFAFLKQRPLGRVCSLGGHISTASSWPLQAFLLLTSEPKGSLLFLVITLWNFNIDTKMYSIWSMFRIYIQFSNYIPHGKKISRSLLSLLSSQCYWFVCIIHQ